MKSFHTHNSHIPTEYEFKHSKWIQKMLHVYWVVISAHFAIQVGCFLFLKYDRTPADFMMNVLFWPTAISCSCILFASWVDRRFSSYSFYTMSAASTVIAWTIIHVNYDIRIILAICLLPIFASVLFFSKKRVWIVFLMQMIGYLLVLFDPAYRSYLSSFDMVSIPAFLILGTYVAQVIVTSGVEVLEDLQASMLAKQDLIVRNAIMSKQSKTDGLTNLYNQSSFKDYYEKAFEYANSGMSMHLALIDIDDFKSINDTYGHRVGDIILEKVSLIIQETITSSDIAARYGGEEFALLMFEQSFKQAYALVEQIRQKIALMGHLELEGASITVSIGLKSYSPNLTKDKLFEEVDACLYAAKRTGKNKTVTSLDLTSSLVEKI
ncbi:GGDEF domain-containing protein [Paenibacillus sp. ClWae2A]|uniref:GGDEF domain-containing protein n=1 Tax=Paenibacillus sp. ClWae2A TaxID=3057177 RepID=UPI0028F5F284|nr:GGDEF domain-containing protein [Paenibacillus sp. ClWae2A]MDT9722952.1 GGDEF domain-containing protein [Paenibacillus sp. ClWae2A]